MIVRLDRELRIRGIAPGPGQRRAAEGDWTGEHLETLSRRLGAEAIVEEARAVLKTGTAREGGFTDAAGARHVYCVSPEPNGNAGAGLLVAIIDCAADESDGDAGPPSRRERHWQAVVDSAVDAVITIDTAGHILSFNPAAERTFGYEAGQVIGRNVAVLMPQPYRDEHDGYLDRYLRTGEAHIIGIGREVTGRKRDGTLFPMSLAVSDVKVEGERFFVGVVRDLAARKQMEKRAAVVAEREQQRIGRKLHDSAAQQVSAMRILTERARRDLDRDPERARGHLENLSEGLDEAERELRSISHELVPAEVDRHGLTGALRQLAAQAEQRAEVCCVFENRAGEPEDFTEAVHLYRIAQEAVSNAVRHGRPGRIELHLTWHNDRLRLRVTDDGRGFDAAAPPGEGVGLHTLQYRASLLGAELRIDSEPGRGTAVDCLVQPEREPAS